MSGTEKSFVAENYHEMLHHAKSNIDQVFILQIVKALYDVLWDIDGRYLDYSQCKWNTTASNCDLSYKTIKNGDELHLSVYNPAIEST